MTRTSALVILALAAVTTPAAAQSQDVSPARHDSYCLGIDGVFSDFPDTAITAREMLRAEPRACR